MAATHSSKRRRESRQRATDKAAGARPLATDGRRSAAISRGIRAAIDAERRSLQIAESVLGCLVAALDYSSSAESRQPPDFADAARAVRHMLSVAIDRLDCINLQRNATNALTHAL
jgi:hypothetical protein